jgi:hypothetical protein
MMHAKNISTKERDSNLELFRIVMMLSIVAHHYVVNSGLLGVMAEPPCTWRHYFLYLFGMWGKIGINCFVLITGYFMCKSEITIRKFLKLLLEVWFYKIICFAVFTFVGYEEISLKGLYYALMPITSFSRDFVSCFLVYYLLIPFLNIMVRNLSQRQHTILMALCLLFFSIMDHVPGFKYEFNYVGWFCVLHVMASYIRYYSTSIKILSIRGIYLILLGVSIAVIAVVAHVWCMWQGLPVGGWAYKWVSDSNVLLAVITSVLLFCGFKNLQIGYNKWINTIASSTLGVLLIHANSDTMRQWLWQDVCCNVEWFVSPWMPLHAIGSVLIIYVVCVMIDQIRIMCIEKPLFKVVDKILAKYGRQ